MTRDEALLTGAPKYDGRVCKHDGTTEKYTSCHACCVCLAGREQTRTRTKNPTPRDPIPLTEPTPRILIDVDPDHHRGTAWVDDKPVFTLSVRSHSAEQVAAKLVALGYDNGPLVLRYGDAFGTCPSLYRLAGVRI